MTAWICGILIVACLIAILWVNGTLIGGLEKKAKDAAIAASGTANPPELPGVLQMARGLLAQHGNDFSTSKWDSGDAAVAEVDTWIHAIVGKQPMKRDDLEKLFAENGPIHDVARASGWEARYRSLLIQFDYAVGVFKPG